MRPTFKLLPLLAALALLAGCGSAADGGTPASSTSEVGPLLRDTFANLDKVKSATLDVKVGVEVQGTDEIGGPIAVHLSGPFESQGAGKLPKMRFDASLQGSGQNLSAGLTWTGSKGFVAFQGEQYALSDLLSRQLAAGYEEALKSNDKNARGGVVLATLGVDPTNWLKDARNEGDAKVGDVDTIKVTGTADVGRILDDVQTIAKKATKLGVPGAEGTVTEISPADRKQVLEAIKQLEVSVYTGKDDRILRRITVTAVVDDASSKTGAKVDLDLTLSKVGEQQDISAPKDAKPFTELLDAVGDLSFLGAGLAAGLGEGSDSSSGSGASKAPTEADFEKFTKCVEKAGSDAAKGAECAALLTG